MFWEHTDSGTTGFHNKWFHVQESECNEGKYAVIMPTINKEGPAVMEGLKKILK